MLVEIMPNIRPELPSMTEELALLVDAVGDYAIFLLSPEGEIRSWNRGAARVFGYDAEEIIGRPFFTFYGEGDLRDRKPQRELEVAAAEGRVEDEGWRIRKDGRRFWASTVITPLRDQANNVIGFAKVTRDLTERRNAEEQLRQSEELFRLLVSSVRDYAIFMLDPDGNVATWNAGAHRIKGYEADEIIGRHFSTFYPEEDKIAGKPENELVLARKDGSVEDEGWRVRKDGSRFWANVLITAVFDSTGTLRGFAKVTRDITERRHAEEMRTALLEQREARLQAEEERRRAEASYVAAQEASRAKDEFLMTLSHELRTPMTAILGWARLLPTLQKDDAVLGEAIASIARSAEVQAKLIDDVLDVSRIVSGKLRLSRQTIDVERVILSAIESVRPMAEARSIAVTTNIATDVGMVVADPVRIQQVIWNLLTNAIKFTPRGGKVEVHMRRTSSHVQLAVCDTGEGIDPAFLPHVFEPFRQAESPRTRVHGGLGLGLSIVRYLAEAHGGTVSAESQGKGHGATFTFTIPVAAMAVPASERETAGHLRPPSAIDPERLRSVKVLVVDDDRDTRSMVSTVLASAGATVRTADSAQNAIDQVETAVPDLVLTDIAMPDVDGLQLLRMIRERDQGGRLPVLALSAFPAGAGSSADGFDRYLTKPIDPGDLVDAVAKMVGR